MTPMVIVLADFFGVNGSIKFNHKKISVISVPFNWEKPGLNSEIVKKWEVKQRRK